MPSSRRRNAASSQPKEPVEAVIEKLVHGGQGLGTMQDGRKVFAWNALPGERVMVSVTKDKKSYAEGVAVTILEASPDRQAPREEQFLATSPWQILSLPRENDYKRDIVRELFEREAREAKLDFGLPQFSVTSAEPEWNYRNKMEYSFFGDEAGLHLALYNRGTHQKRIITGSALASPAIDTAANDLVKILNSMNIRAGDLKSVMLRSERGGSTVAALFTKLTEFPMVELPPSLKGIVVYHSNPRSPASVPTKKLFKVGETKLKDELLDTEFTYEVSGFFQVNLPIFEEALRDIRRSVGTYAKPQSAKSQSVKPQSAKAQNTKPQNTKPGKPPLTSAKAVNGVVDMYSGVGSIGLSLLDLSQNITLVEIDEAGVRMAGTNAAGRAEVIHASSEFALEHIVSDKILIVDPPRAGLHTKLTDHILEAQPPLIVYLSCNPATQARDIIRLSSEYELKSFAGYNFFPHTPHIETLAVLERR